MDNAEDEDRCEHKPCEHSIRDLFNRKKPLKMAAPMVRYSKLGFRTLIRQYDCDLAFTPMIMSNSFVRSTKARDNEFKTNRGDRPLVVQFAANSPNDLADAAEIIAPYADGVDLNCGCPQRWALSDGYGAHLIKKPQLIKDMVQQTQARVGSRDFTTSVKIRIHRDLRETVDLCRKAESAGVSWITVHGRTVQDRTEPANYDAIKLIKDSVSVPVVANGDIRYLEDVQRVYEETGVDGVMAARGILENPAMFAGYGVTPAHCVQRWTDISLRLGTPFQCFHHHLIYMMEKSISRAEKRVFNVLTSTTAVLEHLQENFGIESKLHRLKGKTTKQNSKELLKSLHQSKEDAMTHFMHMSDDVSSMEIADIPSDVAIGDLKRRMFPEQPLNSEEVECLLERDSLSNKEDTEEDISSVQCDEPSS